MDDGSHELGQPLGVQEVRLLQTVVFKMEKSPCIVHVHTSDVQGIQMASASIYLYMYVTT